MSHVVEIENLTKDYEVGFVRKRKVRALDGLSLTVNQGEIFGFLGANGAGKTTTLKLLMTLIFPTAGSARILNHDIADVRMHRRIGYLPENPYFYDYLTAFEFLTFCGQIFGYSKTERTIRASQLLARVRLDESKWNTQLRKFSKGMLQRVGLAQAIINDPEVVFLDEPMSGLDPLGRREVRQLIMRLRDEGRTVFFSSHILADAEALCSRIAIVAKGRLMATGALADILAVRMLGWEIVVDGLTAPPDTSRGGLTIQNVTKIDEQRYAVEVAPHVKPEDAVAQFVGRGGRLISVNPIRET